MTQRKVLELAMNRAKELWIFTDVKACDADYYDPALNKLEEGAWKVYEECCRLYMEELQKIREQRRQHP